MHDIMTREPQESMDIDSGGRNKKIRYGPKENGFKLYPVSASDSGVGLPYAPEDWPNLGDKWGWKAGRRTNITGYFRHRCIYLPNRLCQDGKARSFKSRLSLEQYIRAKFPDADVCAFFASFSWEIPSKLCEEGQNLFQEHPPSDNDLRCEAGNRFCSSLGAGEKFAMFCDICCNETGFCRDCCCILCCKTISEAFGGYDYIRCEANIEGSICGHNCHIDCALGASMIGTVGGRIDLDAEYYCRRCDSRTDLVSHVKKLVKNCESIDSRGDIEMVLKVCIRVLRGSKKTNANHLLHQIELAMEKLKKKAETGDIWKKEDTSAVTSEFKLRVDKGNVVIHPVGSGTAPEEVDAVIEDMNAFYGCGEASEEASIENFEANLRANVVHMYQLGQVTTRAFRDFQHLKSQLVSTDNLRLEVHEAQKALRVSEASQEALSAELTRVKDQLAEAELRCQAREDSLRESKGKIVVLEKALELAHKEKAELKAAIPEGQKNFLRSWFKSPTYRATIFSESIRRALIFYDRALIHIQGRGWMSPEFDRSRVGLKFDYNLKSIPDPSKTDWAKMTEGDSFSWVWSEGCYNPEPKVSWVWSEGRYLPEHEVVSRPPKLL